jgi:hypothetical protein
VSDWACGCDPAVGHKVHNHASEADMEWSRQMIRTGLRRKRLREAAHGQGDHSLCRPETCDRQHTSGSNDPTHETDEP